MLKKICLIIVASLGFGGTIHAEEMQQAAGFTIECKANEFQHSDQSWYDLKMAPGQSTTLHLTINNISDQAATYNIAVNPAVTSDNVVIDYSTPVNVQLQTDGQPLLQLQNLVTLSDKRLNVAAHAKRAFTVDVKMPQQTFDGIVAGAIKVERMSAKRSSGITNEFALVKGLVVRQNNQVIKPELEVAKIKVGTYKNLPGVQVQLVNPANINISGLKIDANLIDSQSGKIVATKACHDGSVAPNSSFNYVFRSELPLPVGDYQFVGTATDRTGNQWHWKDPFVIKAGEMSKHNPVTIEQGLQWWWAIILLMGITITGLSWFIFNSRRNK
ncbi:MAG: DUF916 and DUF3324 domain-containing protein [Lactobacillaceae bacterium]|jgi:hypothetical protein|nr:DUF916 and DUF3324 domain-containing protein [Lactobacillaceae bacterium]